MVPLRYSKFAFWDRKKPTYDDGFKEIKVEPANRIEFREAEIEK